MYQRKKKTTTYKKRKSYSSDSEMLREKNREDGTRSSSLKYKDCYDAA